MTVSRVFSDIERKLTLPSPHLTDAGEQRHARLLARILLVLITIGIIVNFSLLAISIDWRPSFLPVSVGILVLGFTYSLSRTRHYQAGVIIAALIPTAIELVNYINFPEDTSIAATMVIGIILGSIFLSKRMSLVVIGTNLMILLLVPVMSTVNTGEWALNLSQLIVASSLIFMLKTHQASVEAARQADMQAIQDELQSSYNNLRAVLQNMPIVVAATNAEDQLVLWNTGAIRATGYRQYEIQNYSQMAKMLNLENAGHDLWGTEVEITHRTGTTNHLALFDMSERFPVPQWKFWMVAVDITDVKHREEMLQEHHRLTGKFQQEQERNELIQRVISALSHDLRLPLAVISTSRENLSRYYDRYTDEQREKKLNTIAHQVTVADELLTDTIYAIRRAGIERPLNLEIVNIAALCEVSVNEIGLTVGQKQTLIFDNQGGVSVAKIDEVLFNRILINLLGNAIKYSQDGGEIRLELSQDESWIICNVVDQGIGIDEADLPYIFDLFYRADAASQISGTGLGLNTVKECVDAHHGEITVDSTPGKGTRFTVKLPRLPLDVEEPASLTV